MARIDGQRILSGICAVRTCREFPVQGLRPTGCCCSVIEELTPIQPAPPITPRCGACHGFDSVPQRPGWTVSPGLVVGPIGLGGCTSSWRRPRGEFGFQMVCAMAAVVSAMVTIAATQRRIIISTFSLCLTPPPTHCDPGLFRANRSASEYLGSRSSGALGCSGYYLHFDGWGCQCR